MLRTAFITIGLSISIFSCTKRESTEISVYNIDSLLDAQINVLTKNRVVLTKTIRLNQSVDSVVLTSPDALFLSDEFDAFRQLKVLNKAVTLNAYKTETHQDSRSNLLVRSFVTDDNSLPVKSLKIYFLKTPDNIKKLEATYVGGDAMYHRSQSLKMEFDNIFNTVMLIHYGIEGKQKIIMNDAVNLSIEGSIKIINPGSN